ncbi:MAG: glycerate kinase [Peptostreptococcaceae bacterium]|nr:glycerate kinase [Peptostreptococcaceae bacterium]
MKKCILLPDSFKGTMTSIQVSTIMKEVILDHWPNCEVISIPVADGGEGTVDCFLQILGGDKITLRTKNPYMEEIDSFYGLAGDVAIIEMAASAGLPLVMDRLNPMETTTYGVGELIADAITHGCKKLIIGLGGSCTNDAGAGMAAALGTKFYNAKGESFIPLGGTLPKVKRIDKTETEMITKGLEIIGICDIDNPLYGKQGAAYVFAPQKGADQPMVELLDSGLRSFAAVIQKASGVEVANMKGAGAAGGMGAGVFTFLNGKLKQGINTVLDLVEFETLLDGCDAVFTGEGRLDSQSFSGKVIAGIARRAKPYNIPVIAVVGIMDENMSEIFNEGVTEVYETGRGRDNFAEIKAKCIEDLRLTLENIPMIRKNKSQSKDINRM